MPIKMPSKPAPLHAPGWIGEFRSFIMRGNVVDLAVGIIIGAAFTTIVQSLVKDIFTPFIGLLVGVILILGGLQYLPSLALGPLAEHFSMLAGKTF